MLNIGNYIIGGSSSSHLSNCSWNWMQPKCLPDGDVSLSILKTVVQHNKYGIWIHKSKFRISFQSQCRQNIQVLKRSIFHLIEKKELFGATHCSSPSARPLLLSKPYNEVSPVHNNPLASDANSSQTTRPPRGWKTDIFRRKPIISILTHFLKFSSIESQSSIRC